MKRAAPAVVLALAMALLGACGGVSSTRVVGPTDASQTARSVEPTGSAGRPGSAPSVDPITSRQGATRARGVSGENDETQATGAKPSHPCGLVTRSEARAIVGGLLVEPREAPQGPTCIFQPRRLKGYITIAVESARSSGARPRGRTVARVRLHGHTAYCVQRGGLTMLVPLAGGRVLNIGAPCPIAARFAAKALSRLSA